MGNVRSKHSIAAGLTKKGFIQFSDADHVHFYLSKDANNLSDINTKISHGPKSETIGVELISKMARQCHLSRKQFLDLIDCRLAEEAYREILRQQGFVA